MVVGVYYLTICALENSKLNPPICFFVPLCKEPDAFSIAPRWCALSGYISRRVKISARFLTLWLPLRAIIRPSATNN